MKKAEMAQKALKFQIQEDELLSKVQSCEKTATC